MSILINKIVIILVNNYIIYNYFLYFFKTPIISIKILKTNKKREKMPKSTKNS